jgi:GNAT superfamily N-acetyltransferase
MRFREFKAIDAEFCFMVRSNAFIKEFHNELTPEEIAACVNAYLPNDYIRISDEMPHFIVEENDVSVGFFNLKHKDKYTAELPMIYLDLEYLGKGIGSACISYIEKWIAINWKEVNTLIVDTVIPKYNSGFYKKVGFIPVGESFCDFRGLKVKALRLKKDIKCVVR